MNEKVKYILDELARGNKFIFAHNGRRGGNTTNVLSLYNHNKDIYIGCNGFASRDFFCRLGLNPRCIGHIDTMLSIAQGDHLISIINGIMKMNNNSIIYIDADATQRVFELGELLLQKFDIPIVIT